MHYVGESPSQVCLTLGLSADVEPVPPAAFLRGVVQLGLQQQGAPRPAAALGPELDGGGALVKSLERRGQTRGQIYSVYQRTKIAIYRDGLYGQLFPLTVTVCMGSLPSELVGTSATSSSAPSLAIRTYSRPPS